MAASASLRNTSTSFLLGHLNLHDSSLALHGRGMNSPIPKPPLFLNDRCSVAGTGLQTYKLSMLVCIKTRNIQTRISGLSPRG